MRNFIQKDSQLKAIQFQNQHEILTSQILAEIMLTLRLHVGFEIEFS